MKPLEILSVIFFYFIQISSVQSDHEIAEKIVTKFSNSSSLDQNQFTEFLTLIGLKVPKNSSCLDYVKIFSYNFNCSDEFLVESRELQNICLNIIQQMLVNPVNDESSHNDNINEESRSLVWIYGTVAITAISLCGLAGVLVIPIVDKHYYFYVLQFFMALAVGTLTGDSLMHLLPHSIQPSSSTDFDMHELHVIVMQKGIAMMLGIIGFWFIERILKLITDRNARSDSDDPNEVKQLKTDHQHGHSHGNFKAKPESLSSIVWMVVLGDGLHNFTDGMTIGAAFSHSIAGGFSTTVAVFCHELPHELGDFAILLKAGMPPRQAIFYNILSSILSFFGMCMGIMFGDTPETSKWVFAVAAGLFIYIALVDMVR